MKNKLKTEKEKKNFRETDKLSIIKVEKSRKTLVNFSPVPLLESCRAHFSFYKS
jgi:hypothetical protein